LCYHVQLGSKGLLNRQKEKNRKTERHKDRYTEILKYWKTERQKDNKTERQKEKARKTDRQKDWKTKKKKDSKVAYMRQLLNLLNTNYPKLFLQRAYMCLLKISQIKRK